MGRRRHGSGRQAPLLLAVTLAGCGGNVTVSRGFESREVLSLRDPTITLASLSDVQGQDPTLIYTTQPGDAGAPAYWSLNLASGALTNLGPSLPSPDGGAPPTSRYLCSTEDLMADGTRTLVVTDTSIGATLRLADVTAFFDCVKDDGTISLFTLDRDTGHQILWSGPYQTLAPVALPVDILRVALYLGDGTGQLAKVLVIAAPSGQSAAPSAQSAAPSAQSAAPSGQSSGAGIYTIDAVTNAVTQVVPAAPASAAWADGAPQAGSLDSATVSLDVDISIYDGVYFYGRTMSDGGTTLFAGPLSSGPASELALFQLTASGTPSSPLRVRVTSADDAAQAQPSPQMVGWQVDGANGAPSQLMVWDQARGQVTACPSNPRAIESGVVAADGAHVLFRASQLSGQLTFAPLQLVTLADGQPHTCVELDPGNVIWADFSGDGSRIAWIAKTRVGSDTDLFTANSDGSDATMILTGEIFAAGFVGGTNHLEMAYGGDLVWLDVDDPTHFSYVAEQLFGTATGVGGSWYVAGYNFSSQDATGLLGVVNLESGAKQLISPAVAQYLVTPQTMELDGGAGSRVTGLYRVVYLVRGRNPSSQDGIWVATVRAADLQ